jgi:phage terminase large subunit-like protein
LRTYKKYIQEILSDKLIVGEYLKLAIQRHLNDIERQETGRFPYYFDEKEGERFIKFAQLCKHWKGEWAGTFIKLQPWQQFYFMELFGWKKKDGTRRFKSAYCEIGRKNSKTTMCALRAMAHIHIDKEPGAQVYIAATKEDQAKIGFRDIQEIIKITPGLDKYFHIFTKSILSGTSFIKPLGSDSKTQDGFDPSYGIIDEYHAHPTAGMLNVLEAGMGARRSPMIDIITTAGFNRQSPCYQEVRKASLQILKGIKKDETHFALIYALDKGDDWEDEKVWIKANPNLDVSVKKSFLKERYKKAKNEGGSKEVDFKTKNLNIWTDTKEVWVPDDIFMSAAEKFDISELNGRQCFGGIDLASTRDISAFILLFPDVAGKHIVLCYYFIPELSAQERIKKDGVNYGTWIKDGYIIETEGNVTDYGYIRQIINELNKQYEIRRIAYDRWNSSQLIIDLTGDGFDCMPYGQGFASMSGACKELEKLIHAKQINHLGNPVLRWMNNNVIMKTDPAGNIKIDKSNSNEKVDGMVALVMALGNYMSVEKEPVMDYEIKLI